MDRTGVRMRTSKASRRMSCPMIEKTKGGTAERLSSSDSLDKGSRDPSSENIQVAVRIRPLMPHEQGTAQVIDVIEDGVLSDHPCTVTLGEEQKFTFDEAFPVTTTQKQVFDRRVTPLIGRCLDGFNSTIIAYGQTGAGKTHTMMGPSMAMDDEEAGVVPRAVQSIFDQLNAKKENGQGFDYEIRVQFLELYGEEIRDLLAPKNAKREKLTVRDIGEEPEVVGATQHKVESAQEALDTLTIGMMGRVTASTAMNASSSRSHALMSLIVDQSVNTELQSEPEGQCSKFTFVDLAGAERQKRTKATGQRLKEGVDINKGLLILGNVISALGDPTKKGGFVPYRDSKLTRLLKGSLGGNHKTLMMACVSPSETNLAESVNCLRYANRAKNIKNHAVQNVESKGKVVSELKSNIKLLANDLLRAYSGDTSAGSFSKEALLDLAGGGAPTKNSGGSSTLPIDASTKGADSGEIERLRSRLSQQDEQVKDICKLRDDLEFARMKVAEKAEREQALLEANDRQTQRAIDQVNGFFEEITRLQDELAARPKSAPDTAAVARRNSIIAIDIPVDRENGSEDGAGEEKVDLGDEILALKTDVCGCKFLTIATSEGVKLVKDPVNCTKGHGQDGKPRGGQLGGPGLITRLKGKWGKQQDGQIPTDDDGEEKKAEDSDEAESATANEASDQAPGRQGRRLSLVQGWLASKKAPSEDADQEGELSVTEDGASNEAEDDGEQDEEEASAENKLEGGQRSLNRFRGWLGKSQEKAEGKEDGEDDESVGLSEEVVTENDVSEVPELRANRFRGWLGKSAAQGDQEKDEDSGSDESGSPDTDKEGRLDDNNISVPPWEESDGEEEEETGDEEGSAPDDDEQDDSA